MQTLLPPAPATASTRSTGLPFFFPSFPFSFFLFPFSFFFLFFISSTSFPSFNIFACPHQDEGRNSK